MRYQSTFLLDVVQFSFWCHWTVQVHLLACGQFSMKLQHKYGISTINHCILCKHTHQKQFPEGFSLFQLENRLIWHIISNSSRKKLASLASSSHMKLGLQMYYCSEEMISLKGNSCYLLTFAQFHYKRDFLCAMLALQIIARSCSCSFACKLTMSSELCSNWNCYN